MTVLFFTCIGTGRYDYSRTIFKFEVWAFQVSSFGQVATVTFGLLVYSVGLGNHLPSIKRWREQQPGFHMPSELRRMKDPGGIILPPWSKHLPIISNTLP